MSNTKQLGWFSQLKSSWVSAAYFIQCWKYELCDSPKKVLSQHLNLKSNLVMFEKVVLIQKFLEMDYCLRKIWTKTFTSRDLAPRLRRFNVHISKLSQVQANFKTDSKNGWKFSTFPAEIWTTDPQICKPACYQLYHADSLLFRQVLVKLRTRVFYWLIWKVVVFMIGIVYHTFCPV
jgi:hypothetical protein